MAILALAGCGYSGASLPVVAPQKAQMADAFVDSVGMNVHFSYEGSVYTTQTQQLETYLKQMGVRHLRDQMAWQGSDPSGTFYQLHNQLGALGIKTDYILTSIDYPMSQVAAYPTLVNDLEAVEPANEWDNVGDANWVADITAQQTALYSQIRSTPAGQSITVAAPSLAVSANATLLGNIASVADVSNLHAYFGGWNPGNDGAGAQHNPAYFLGWAQINVPSKPVWVTETGYWGVQEAYFGGGGVSPNLMATYTTRSALEWWMAGAARSYVYELADDVTTQFFGLIGADGTPKPPYYALSNLLNLLKDPGTAFTPGTLAYGLSGASSQVRQLLFAKRDGSFYLVLWVESPGMDAATEANITVPSQTVQVTLGQFPSAVTSYQWNSDGTVSTTTLPAAPLLSVSVGPDITILKIQ